MGRDVHSLSREELEAEVLHLRARSVAGDPATHRGAIFESAVDFAIVVTDPAGLITDWNRGAERLLGWSAAEMIGQTVDRFFTPEDRAQRQVETEMRLALRDGRAPDERWHMRKDGVRFWASGELMPLRQDGAHTGFVKILRDRTEAHEAGLRITESEARYRQLFNNIDEGFCVIEFIDGPHGPLSDYVHVEANPGYERHTGIPDIVGMTLREIAPDEAEGWLDIYGRVLRTGQPVRFEREFVAAGRYIEVTANRVEPASRNQVAVLFNDITVRVRAAEQQTILNKELSHRMKNMLAMVQAVATQTMRNATDLEVAREGLAARLIAMGKAHDILLTGNQESASLETVVQGSVAVHDDPRASRFALSGPFVQIGSKAALSLALMVHELATNAAKYGALSVPDGLVTVSWVIEDDPPEPSVRWRWVETGGPPVSPPTRRGFGTRLIERGLAGAVGGEVTMTFPPEGVTCEIVAPLAKLAADE